MFVTKDRVPYIIIAVLLVITLGSLTGGVYIFRQYKDAEYRLEHPTEVVEKDNKDLVAKVRKLMILPSENPEIFDVTNVETLRNQKFFANALDGDKVLLFQVEKKAVLYRPSNNVIVEVAPIILGDGANETASESASPMGNIISEPSPVSTGVPTKNLTPTP